LGVRIPEMKKYFVCAGLAFVLSGCGFPEYFNQQPNNVRPESQAVAAVLGVSRGGVLPTDRGPAPASSATAGPPNPGSPAALQPTQQEAGRGSSAASFSPELSDGGSSLTPATRQKPAFAPAAPVVPAAPANEGPDAHCDSVAKTRAGDAAASGVGRELQKIIRQGTYANCLAWDTAHGNRP
jgi:hypothetical protein